MKVVFIVGPTGTGKSEVASRLAEGRRAAVVNCDSIQLYSGLSVGAAMPTPEQLARAPHELYGFVAPPEEVTAGDYARHCHGVFQKLKDQVDWAFVVGGTGFYFQALEKGMPELPPSEPVIRGQYELLLEQDGEEKVWNLLNTVDPSAAAKISAKDHYRLVRALEVCHLTGRKFSEIMRSHVESQIRFPFPLIKIGLDGDRDFLRDRIRARTQAMIAGGLLEEVRGLLDQGLSDWPPLASVGYREAASFLKGEMTSLSELEEEIVISTAQLTKKQRTWFKRDQDIRWFSIENPALMSQISEHLSL